MQWLAEHWLLVLPMVLGAVAVAWRMPKGGRRPSAIAWGFGIAALGILGGTGLKPTGVVLQDVFFYLFAAVSVTAATLMITHRNPVYSALWFAVVTLAVCGLFLLQSAPFLASATVIVYAGAIIVTFLFVLMLAQQAGATNYDQNSRQPGIAVFTGFVLLGTVLFVLTPSKQDAAAGTVTGFVSLSPVAATVIEPLGERHTPQSTSVASPATFGTMRALGRALFGDYVFAVELAGTLLLIASIGAIVIAPKRSSGKR